MSNIYGGWVLSLEHRYSRAWTQILEYTSKLTNLYSSRQCYIVKHPNPHFIEIIAVVEYPPTKTGGALGTCTYMVGYRWCPLRRTIKDY